MFSITELALNQASTQQTTGGLTEAYQENGTYVKSFTVSCICRLR